MNKKKDYIPPRSQDELKGMHIKVLIGAIIVTLIVVIITSIN